MRRRTPIGAKRLLSQYVLRQVAQGDYRSLLTFSELISVETISVDALDALFAVFDKSPDSVNTSSSESLLMGPTALQALQNVLSILLDHPGLKDLLTAAEDKLFNRAARLAIWMEVSVHFTHLAHRNDSSQLEEVLSSISAAMTSCLKLEGDVAEALLAKPQTIRALLKLWSSHHTGQPSKMVSCADNTGESAIVVAMEAYVDSESGLQSLHDTFFNSPETLRAFSKAASARITNIPEHTWAKGMHLDVIPIQDMLERDIAEV
ncbi:hypothetical protein BKA70DRAFT_1569587 [Coprinopsis sp. MPI-PUGE-AT-0042]|nr:hypothetical protein BKA70DRAFT_1569587 [Coprinopsis sp. MPI-PUGE-AT-0042]